MTTIGCGDDAAAIEPHVSPGARSRLREVRSSDRKKTCRSAEQLDEQVHTSVYGARSGIR
jgi:hypothetical protein